MAPVPVHPPAPRAAGEQAVADGHMVRDSAPSLAERHGRQVRIAGHAAAQQGDPPEIQMERPEHLYGLGVAFRRLDEDRGKGARPSSQLAVPRHEDSALGLADPQDLGVGAPSGKQSVETQETEVPCDVAEHGVDQEARCWPVFNLWDLGMSLEQDASSTGRCSI